MSWKKGSCETCKVEDSTHLIVKCRADGSELCDDCSSTIDWPKCITCGESKDDSSDGYNHIASIRDGNCFSCWHWSDAVKARGYTAIRTKDGTHYSFRTEQPISDDRSNFLGHGGRRFLIVFNDGTEIITNNLWAQGTMPKYWRDRYPPNASIKSAPDPPKPDAFDLINKVKDSIK